MRTLITFGLVLVLTACAGPVTRLPAVGTAAVSAEQLNLQRRAIDTHLNYLARALNLTWPLLEANADLCGKRAALRLGLQLVRPEGYAQIAFGLTQAQVLAAGVPDGVSLAAVASGSPAAAAGLKPRDVLRAVGDTPVDDGTSLGAVTALLRQAAGQGEVTLTVQSAGMSPRQVKLTPRPACAIAVSVRIDATLNAYTDGTRIVFHSALLRAVPDDLALQAVSGHELAHALMGHPRKAAWNAAVSGSAVTGTLASVVGTVADSALGLFGVRPPASLGGLGQQMLRYPWNRDLEREADYVGLYLMARAGLDIGDAEAVHALFAVERPSGTWIGLSHPASPERRVAIEAARVEILGKQRAGVALLPEGWQP